MTDNVIIDNTRDSFAAELLLSVIVTLTIMTGMIFFKMYLADIKLTAYPPFSLLIVTVIHTFIRRSKINNIFIITLLHIAASVAFYFVVINIYTLGFSWYMSNRIYLVVALLLITIFSISYRIKPFCSACDREFVVFPASVHAVGYILLKIEEIKGAENVFITPGIKNPAETLDKWTGNFRLLYETRAGYLSNVLLHALIISILYIIMRQLAVFDAKYYYSMKKASKTSVLLKKQNHRTVIALVCIFTFTMVIVFFFPYDLFSELLTGIIKGIGVFFFFIMSLLKRTETYVDLDIQEQEEMGEIADISADDPLITILAVVLIILLLIGIIFIIIKTLSSIIKNMPKTTNAEEQIDDDALIDTIEKIEPEEDQQKEKARDFGSGHEKQVRKRFYDKTRHAMKKGLPVSGSSTPGQIEAVLLANGDQEITDLREEYEKVRYGKRTR